MKHGPAWVIFEESFHQGTKNLLSILSPRRTILQVASFLEQLCVDRTSSLEERLSYKKSTKSAPYKPIIDGNVMHCGDEPFLVAIFADQTNVRDNELHISYRIITERGPDLRPLAWEERKQAIRVDA